MSDSDPTPIKARVPQEDSPTNELGHDRQTAVRNAFSELVAVVLIMLAGPGLIVANDGNVETLGVAVSFGVAMAIAIGVLGAVANPMFTLALLLVREIDIRQAAGDWIGQVAGGLIGGFVIFSINDLERPSVGSNGWDRDGFGSLGAVMSAELVFGIVIVVVFLAAISQGLSTSAIAAFTGAIYGVAALVLFAVDGAGVNPARSIGSAVFSDTDPNALVQVWAFVLIPLVAAFGAVFVWLAIDDTSIDDTVFDETILDDAQNQLTGDELD